MPFSSNLIAPRGRAPFAAAEAAVGGGGGAAATLLDAQALARLHELDPSGQSGLVKRVLATYAQSLARLLAQLRTAREGADRDAMRHAAHTLKSSSASVGALELSALCAQAEARLRDGAGADEAALLDRLEAEGARILGGLNAT
jgi:HPt (histidine-containing phosphotransfer) domain-containing protein